MEVIQTYEFKLYNSRRNRHLHRSIDLSSEIWNWFIALHKCYYRLYGKHLPVYSLQKHITKVKKRIKYTHWNNLGAQAIQDIAERIDKSYKALFKHHKEKRGGRKSPPKFCKRVNYKSFTLKQTGYKFHDDNSITIMGKRYKFWKSREIKGNIKTLTVKRNKLGEIFIYVVAKKKIETSYTRTGKSVGMDFGLKTFLTFNTGEEIKSPLWYTNTLPQIRKAHRKLSKAKKGSNNRKRALRDLQRLYETLSNQRRDWFFKLSHKLCSEYDIICIEDLNIDGMKRLWGRKVSDLSFFEFISILEWSTLKSGCEVRKIKRFYPSSKTCNNCGFVNESLELKDREWQCPSCGVVLDRDVNAAKNILEVGLTA